MPCVVVPRSICPQRALREAANVPGATRPAALAATRQLMTRLGLTVNEAKPRADRGGGGRGAALHPGEGLHLDPVSAAKAHQQAQGGAGTVDFLLGIIPTTLVSPLVGESVLQTLFVALLIWLLPKLVGLALVPFRRLAGIRQRP